MDRHAQSFLNKTAVIVAAVATFLLLFTLTTCPSPSSSSITIPIFPKSTCDHTHRTFTTHESLNRRLWSTSAWSHRVTSFTHLFSSFPFLSNTSKTLCLLAGAGHEVMALNRMGVDDVTGIDVIDAEPLVRKADVYNLEFFDGVFDVAFCGELDTVLWPVRFVREMERCVRVGGFCVALVEEERGDERVREVVGLFTRGRLVEAANLTFDGKRMTRIVVRIVKEAGGS